jgi:hypothetical protein
MPGYLLHIAAVMTCPHLAPATIPVGQQRVTVSGQFVATASGVPTVTGCPFQVPGPLVPIPQPCVPVEWANYSTRVTVNMEPVLLQAPPAGTGNGVCLSATAIPAGPPTINEMQQRVVGA